MTAPNGWNEAIVLYGDPAKFTREDGTASPIWEARMVSVPFPAPLPLGWNKTQVARSARVNQAAVDETAHVFAALDKKSLWKRFRTYDGGYAWRPQRGQSTKPSLHMLGAALDFDAATNRLGTKGDIDQDIVDIFMAFGWTWGGVWRRKDCMHFQFARGI